MSNAFNPRKYMCSGEPTEIRNSATCQLTRTEIAAAINTNKAFHFACLILTIQGNNKHTTHIIY